MGVSDLNVGLTKVGLNFGRGHGIHLNIIILTLSNESKFDASIGFNLSHFICKNMYLVIARSIPSHYWKMVCFQNISKDCNSYFIRIFEILCHTFHTIL